MTHPVDALPDLLGLELTAALVHAGMRAPWKQGVNQGDPQTYTLNVLGASNTTPIVVTVPPNSLTVSDATVGVRAGRVMQVVIAGVTGNTAANKLSEKPLRNEAWHAVVLSETTFALYDLHNTTGALVPSVGNGAYTGGGTVSKALRDGRILHGREFVAEESSPPKIVMVPAFVATEAPGATGGAATASAFADGEHNRLRESRPIRTSAFTWEVHVWGKEGAPFGPTFALAEALERAAQTRAANVWEAGRGDWIDQHPDAPQRTKIGHWYRFTLTLPIPLARAAVELAADDLDPLLTMSLGDGIGSPETA